MTSQTPGSVVDDSPNVELETPQRRKKWLWLLILLALLAGAGLIWYFFFRNSSESAPPPPQAVNVALQEVETGQFVDSSDYVGNLQASQRPTDGGVFYPPASTINAKVVEAVS
jgi:flagellar basal body-associated protein FliL